LQPSFFHNKKIIETNGRTVHIIRYKLVAKIVDDSSNKIKLNPIIEKKEIIVSLPQNPDIKHNITIEVSG
jgi:hypothetical protein